MHLLTEAAEDPDVISIKMTLYRVAKQSKVVEALIEAAENGKEVVVLVELRARVDEENNIEYGSNQITGASSITASAVATKFNKYGKKSIEETKDNILTSIKQVFKQVF